MKLPLLITIAVVGLLLEPMDVFAQPAHQELSRPQQSSGSTADPDRFLPNRNDHAFPNRRVPSLTPPGDDTHPLTPEEAWPETSNHRQPLPPLTKPGSHNADKGTTGIDDLSDAESESIIKQ